LAASATWPTRIIPIIESIDHQAYAEPFVGMGGIFLRRRRRPPAEFINDVYRAT
jgi:DNA adenine methylase